MSSSEPSHQPLTLDGGPLGQLLFDWHQDRYRHAWQFGESVPALTSIESDSAEIWPVSPPLQQIHEQSFGDGRQVVFGVGMAGRGHWSASFTLIPDLRCWIVELACRCPVSPERLMSSYQATAQPTTDTHRVQLEQAPHVCLEAISPAAILEATDDQVRFQPAQITTGAATTQWAFRIRVDG